VTKIGLLVFPAALLVMAWWSGPASPVYGDILQTTGESVSIPLQAGWNLISLPLSPASTAPSDVFSSISGHYDLVYAYDAFDADDPWKVYDVSALPSFNTLNAISESMGLWVRALDPVTLTVTGTFSVQPGIRLAAGWNLVGYPSLFTRLLDEELTSIAGAYDLVYLYNAFDAQGPWKVYDANGQPSFNTLSHMQPGWGYWIRTSQAMTWTVNSALPAPINICGTITGNTTWGEAAPLYTVTCNTTVNSGVTLTMTAGTVIKMSSGVRLTVKAPCWFRARQHKRYTLHHSGTMLWVVIPTAMLAPACRQPMTGVALSWAQMGALSSTGRLYATAAATRVCSTTHREA